LLLLPFSCLADDQNTCHFAITISVEVHIRVALHIDSRSNQKKYFTPIVIGPVGKQRKESLPHRKLGKAFDWCCVRLLIPWVLTLPSALITALSKTSFERETSAVVNFMSIPNVPWALFSQQFLTKHLRTEQKREKVVSNQTGSSLSVDEQQIKKVEAAGGGPFLFLTYLGRSKGLCSQGNATPFFQLSCRYMFSGFSV